MDFCDTKVDPELDVQPAAITFISIYLNNFSKHSGYPPGSVHGSFNKVILNRVRARRAPGLLNIAKLHGFHDRPALAHSRYQVIEILTGEI